MTPLARYQRDLARIRSLGPKAAQLDALFLHRIARHVRKDGTVSYLGRRFEVPYELSGKTVQLVVDPHAQRVMGVDDDEGRSLGEATLLDPIGNVHRTRRKADTADQATRTAQRTQRSGPNLVEIAHQKYHGTKPSNTNKED